MEVAGSAGVEDGDQSQVQPGQTGGALSLVSALSRLAGPLSAFLTAFLIGSLGALTWFRRDDFQWLSVGSAFADAPWIPFIDSSAHVAGYYRPVIVLVWTLGYRAWGLDPTGYAFLLAALFGAVNVLLYRLGSLLHRPATGVLAALLFATFYPTMASMWWRSLITTGLELLFLVGSLYLFALGFLRGSTRFVAAGVGVTLLAFFTKEQAALIPLLLLGFLLAFHGRRALPGRWPWALPPLLAGVAYLVMFRLPPLLPAAYSFSRFGSSYGEASALGEPLSAMAANALAQAAAFLHLYQVFMGPALLAVLVLLGVGFLIDARTLRLALPYRSAAFAFAWGVVGIFPGLIMTFPAGWYMPASALGVSLLLSMLAVPAAEAAIRSVRDLAFAGRRRARGWWRSKGWMSVGAFVVVALLLVASAGFIVRMGSRDLGSRADHTANFREGVAFLVEEAPFGATVLVAVPSEAAHIPEALDRALALQSRGDLVVRSLDLGSLEAVVQAGVRAYVAVPDPQAAASLESGVLDRLDDSFQLAAEFRRPYGSFEIWIHVA